MSGFVERNLRKSAAAREWMSREPVPVRSGHVALTAWSDAFLPVISVGDVVLGALERSARDGIRLVIVCEGQWMADLVSARRGEPWERMVPARPIRRAMSAREVKAAAYLVAVSGLVRADLEIDPRVAREAGVLPEVIKSGGWSLLSAPLGCASIRALDGRLVEVPFWKPMRTPPGWRAMSLEHLQRLAAARRGSEVPSLRVSALGNTVP